MRVLLSATACHCSHTNSLRLSRFRARAANKIGWSAWGSASAEFVTAAPPPPAAPRPGPKGRGCHWLAVGWRAPPGAIAPDVFDLQWKAVVVAGRDVPDAPWERPAPTSCADATGRFLQSPLVLLGTGGQADDGYGDAAAWTATGLRPDTEYVFRVRARSTVEGWSEWSDTSRRMGTLRMH